MSEFDQLMKAFQQQDAKLNKLLQALPEIVDFARLLRDFFNATSPPKIDRGKRKIGGGKRKRGRPPKENRNDNSDSRSFASRTAKARELNDHPKLMSVPEAATELRVGRSKMWQLVWSGEVDSILLVANAAS